MELTAVKLGFPADANVVVGQSHFIKTVEDLAEVMVNTVPGVKFGLAFCEASGPCLIRHEGNDPDLRACAVTNAQQIAAGHTFVLVMKNAYPVNVLTRIKECVEVCSIFCATANPVHVIVAENEQGRGVVGVIDGSRPKGVEGDVEIAGRREFLRKIGYKY
ncbi:MAG: adenosine-specific kinase [Deltaproteobacteria bacterium]|nr:adenosine-specific kinase [Deltaproteobacteria bacterium]